MATGIKKTNNMILATFRKIPLIPIFDVIVFVILAAMRPLRRSITIAIECNDNKKRIFCSLINKKTSCKDIISPPTLINEFEKNNVCLFNKKIQIKLFLL